MFDLVYCRKVILCLICLGLLLVFIPLYSQETDSIDQVHRKDIPSLVEKIPLSQDTTEQLRMGWVYLQLGAFPHAIYRGVILGSEPGFFGPGALDLGDASTLILPLAYGLTSALTINWVFRSRDVWPTAANMYVSNATMSHMHGIFVADGVFKNRLPGTIEKWYPLTVFGVSWAESWGSFYAAKALKMSYADNLSWVFGNMWGTYWGYQLSQGRSRSSGTEPNLYFRRPLVGATIGIALSQLTQKLFPRTTGDWRAIHAASMAIGLYTHLNVHHSSLQGQRTKVQAASLIGHLAGITGAYIFTSQAQLTDFEGLIFYGGTGLGMLLGYGRFRAIDPISRPLFTNFKTVGTGGIIGFGLSYLVIKTLRSPTSRVKRPTYGSWDVQLDPSALLFAATPIVGTESMWMQGLNPGLLKITWQSTPKDFKSKSNLTSTKYQF